MPQYGAHKCCNMGAHKCHGEAHGCHNMEAHRWHDMEAHECHDTGADKCCNMGVDKCHDKAQGSHDKEAHRYCEDKDCKGHKKKAHESHDETVLVHKGLRHLHSVDLHHHNLVGNHCPSCHIEVVDLDCQSLFPLRMKHGSSGTDMGQNETKTILYLSGRL